MSKVLVEVETERTRQDEIWGEQNHRPADWLTILMEEVGEAAKHAVETRFDYGGDSNYSKYRREMVQVAAVAVAAVESLDRGKWED